MKKTYQITFKAELTEDDVRALNKYFYDTMNESMEIEKVWGLELTEVKITTKRFIHISEIEEALGACKNIDEVNKLLDSIPRRFGEWWVDTIDDPDGAFYEVTNEWFDTMNEELCSKTYQLEIEVEEDDE